MFINFPQLMVVWHQDRLEIMCSLKGQIHLHISEESWHQSLLISILTELLEKPKTILTIQSFHQCSSLVSLKLTTSNFLSWKSHVVLQIRSLGLEWHLIENSNPEKRIKDADGNLTSNPYYTTWLTNGLLTSWLLGIIS